MTTTPATFPPLGITVETAVAPMRCSIYGGNAVMSWGCSWGAVGYEEVHCCPSEYAIAAIPLEGEGWPTTDPFINPTHVRKRYKRWACVYVG